MDGISNIYTAGLPRTVSEIEGLMKTQGIIQALSKSLLS